MTSLHKFRSIVSNGDVVTIPLGDRMCLTHLALTLQVGPPKNAMQEMQNDLVPLSLLRDGLGQLEQGIAVFDADCRLVIWNRRFLELRGLAEHQAFVGAEFTSFLRHFALRGDLGPGDTEALVQANLPATLHGGARRFERVMPDGRVLDVSETGLPGGGFSLVYSDLTERRRQEKDLIEIAEDRARALNLSEARLKLIADEVPAGIAHIDQEMRFLYTNKRFAAAYRRTPQDLVGRSTAEVLHPRTLSESARFFEQSRRGALVDFEMRIELPGGVFKDIRTLLRPETPSSGEVIGFYLLSIDVTRRKTAMSALMGSQKMDALGRMASGISHDFNNLLTIILGNLVPLAENLGGGEMVDEYLAPAISAARRGSSLTQRLLTLARREQYAPEPTNISGAVADICTLLRSSMPRTLEIRNIADQDVPDAIVDRAQLEMALLNLAMNARDATDGKGVITVGVCAYDLQPEEAELLRLPFGPYVRILVADDGCGMTAEQTERIFEPFYTSKAAGAGSGLGLSMVYGFVKQSNGAISVDTTPGEGATFSILLPSVDLQMPAATVDPAAQIPPPHEAERADDVLPLILLVDDDRDVRRTIRRKIADQGYPLIEADDATQALDLLSRIQSVGVVFSDIDMPGGLDGFGLARRIADDFPDVSVVLMSGQAEALLQPKGVAPGVPVLRKPFADRQLADALRLASSDHMRRVSQHSDAGAG